MRKTNRGRERQSTRRLFYAMASSPETHYTGGTYVFLNCNFIQPIPIKIMPTVNLPLLRRLIKRYTDAAVSLTELSTQTEEEAKLTRADWRLAQRRLNEYLDSLDPNKVTRQAIPPSAP